MFNRLGPGARLQPATSTSQDHEMEEDIFIEGDKDNVVKYVGVLKTDVKKPKVPITAPTHDIDRNKKIGTYILFNITSIIYLNAHIINKFTSLIIKNQLH